MISATYSGWEAAAAWLAPISRTCSPRRSATHCCASGARFVGIPASALTQPLPGTDRAIGAVHDFGSSAYLKGFRALTTLSGTWCTILTSELNPYSVGSSTTAPTGEGRLLFEHNVRAGYLIKSFIARTR